MHHVWTVVFFSVLIENTYSEHCIRLQKTDDNTSNLTNTNVEKCPCN